MNMLYKEPIIPQEKKEDFLFSSKPYNEDIDINQVAAIQDFYEKNCYIKEEDIPTFLNWLTFAARTNITHPLDSPLESSFAGKCAIAQAFYNKILDKIKIPVMNFNIGNLLKTAPIHEVTCISIPTTRKNQKTTKTFLLDPTFRQFCLTEENRFERYFEEPRWAVRMATPHPGYFFNLTEKSKAFANQLIKDGYFELTEENLKTYLDPFALYVTPKEAYTDQNNLGKVAHTTTTANEYWQQILNVANKNEPLLGNESFNLDTPKEIVAKKNRSFKNKIKNFFQKQELEDMFAIPEENKNTKQSKKIPK